MKWFVQIVNGKTGKIEREHGPVSEFEAITTERRFQQRTLDMRHLYTRRFDENSRPKPPELPEIGTELTTDDFAKFISGDRPAHMHTENLEFLKMVHRTLRDDGVWGWPGTMTIWRKTPNGFRRSA